MPRQMRGVLHPDWAKRNRPAATSVLTSRCTITREGPLGTGTFNDVTGGVTGPLRIVVAVDLACRVEVTRSRERELQVGEQAVTVRRVVVQVPWDHVGVAVNDRLEVTASDNPVLVGQVLRITDVSAVSLSWSRMLRAEFDQG